MTDQVSHPYTTMGKIIVLYIISNLIFLMLRPLLVFVIRL
jgi:hypothetical protein